MSENVDMNKLVETIKATMHDMDHSEDYTVRLASIAQFKYHAEAWITQLIDERERFQKALEYQMRLSEQLHSDLEECQDGDE